MDIYSFSKLNTKNQCDFAYFRAYKLHKRGKDNVYNIHGTIFHELVENMQQGKISKKQALEEFEDILIKHSLSDKNFTSEKIEHNYFESMRNYITYFKPFKAKRVVIERELIEHIGKPRKYIHREYGSRPYEIIAEHECLAPPIMRGFVDITLYLDLEDEDIDKKILIDIDEFEGIVDIIDLKTSSIYNKEKKVENGRQLVLYGLMMAKRGYQIGRLGWDMMKYCRASFNGKRSKRVMRNKLVSEFQNQLYDALVEYGTDIITAQQIIEKAVETNDLTILPQEVRDLLHFEKEIIEYPFNEKTIKDTLDFINETVKDIESKSDLEDEWKPRKITRNDNYFCSNLCGHRDHCSAYKKFVEQEKDNFISQEKADEFESILG